MDGDPYSRILSVMRGESAEASMTGETSAAGLGALPAKMRLGIVTQKSPLKISVAGIEQPTSALKINERLTKGAKWTTAITSSDGSYSGLSGELSGSVTCALGSPELNSVTGGTLQSTNTVINKATVKQIEIDLDVGDRVLTLTEDDQSFYILMKVVNAV